MDRNLVFAGLSLVVFLVQSLATPSTADAQLWQKNVFFEGYQPLISPQSMDWDENDHLHLILSGDNLYHLWFDGEEWQVEMKTPNDEYMEYATMSMTSDGVIHALVRSGLTLRYFTLSESGWNCPGYFHVKFPDCQPIRIDSQGHPHTVFVDNYKYRTHAVFDDKKWSFNTLNIADEDCYETGFEIDSEDNIHVCFIDQGHLIYRKYTGLAWQEDMVMTGYPRNIMLKLDNLGLPHIVYIFSDDSGDHLGYSVKKNGCWFNEIVGNCSSWTSMTFDINNDPHIICSWSGLYHFYRDNNVWVEEAIDPITIYQDTVSAGFDSGNTLTVGAVEALWRYVAVFRKNGNTWEVEKLMPSTLAGEVSIALDKQDVVHGICMNATEMQLEYGTIENGAWSHEVLKPDLRQGAAQLSIDIDGDNAIHCSYFDRTASSIVHMEKKAEQWQTETVCECKQFLSSEMAAGDNGDLAILASTRDELMMFRRIGGVWSHVLLMPETWGLVTWGAVSLCMDSENRPHGTASVTGPTPVELFHVYLDGNEWKTEVIHSLNVGTGMEKACITMDSSDFPRVAQKIDYVNHSIETNLIYCTRDEQGWHSQITYIYADNSPLICTDSVNRPFLVYNENDYLGCFIGSQSDTFVRSFLGYYSSASSGKLVADSTDCIHLAHDSNRAFNYAYLPLPRNGVRLEIPSTDFTFRDIFSLNIHMRRAGDTPLLHAPLCLILEYQDNYWFWPNWEHTFDCNYVDLVKPADVISVVPAGPIYWSYEGGIDGLVFWAALLNEDMTEIIGGDEGLSRWEFGFH